MESLGNSIRKLRENKELPLRTVAAYLDIDQAILSKIERGQRKASRKQVVKLAQYFKVKENELITTWLSDKLVDDLQDEKTALKALELAEERVAYGKYQKINRSAILKKINSYFVKDGRVSKAWVFGSFSRREEDYKSDIDILIEVPPHSKFSLFDLSDIQYHLEKTLSTKVDLVMREAVRPPLMERMKNELMLVYER
ncbi:MAG TPA: nucleotidyltransferase domain-containing protein [Cyclobacteriaceae bacterium]|jgi:predicted nucleotidyltransferase